MRVSSLRHLPHCLGAAALLSTSILFWFFSGVPTAEAFVVEAGATDVQIDRQDHHATITARIRVRNRAGGDITGLAIFGAEDGLLKGQTVYVGFVQSEGQAVSDGVCSFTVDRSKNPMPNFLVPVTLQFTLNGEQQELSVGLSFSLLE